MDKKDLYEILGVAKDATSEQIKKAYYRQAMKYHPDRHTNDPPEIRLQNEKAFKEVNEAYQVLSDEKLRNIYDKHGKSAVENEATFQEVDPHEIFKHFFGGDAFVDIIGEISFVQLLMDLVENEQNNRITQSNDPDHHRLLTQQQEENIRRKRAQRISHLSAKLVDKLSLYSEGHYTADEFKEYCKKEANNLSRESLGPELLHTVGYVYSMRAKQFIGKDTFLGLPSLYHSIKEKGHIVSNAYSTAKAVISVVGVAREAQRAAQNQGASSEAIQVDPEKAFHAIWKAASMEVEGVLREVCDAVLTIPHGSSYEIVKKRATALKILGDSYRHHPSAVEK